MGLFKNKKKAAAEESTSGLNAADLIAGYEAGVLPCNGCGSEIEFDGVEPLTQVPCPACDYPILIPWDLEEWWVTEPLKAGGFGLIFLGRFKDEPDRKVAVKILKHDAHQDPAVVKEFERESEVCYALDPHPHIPDTYGIGEHDGRPFIALEHINGTSFFDYVNNREEPVGEEMGLYYAVDIVSALVFLYEHNYLHRDIKPRNIMITRNGLLKLLDFGNAMTIEEAAANTSPLVHGSPHYMPPERYQQKGEDLRSDIYSLGLVIYFMLSGQKFIAGKEIRSVAHQHTKQLRFVSQSNIDHLSEETNQILNSMIRRSPGDRYQSYEDLFADLSNQIMRLHRVPSKDPAILARRKHTLENYWFVGPRFPSLCSSHSH